MKKIIMLVLVVVLSGCSHEVYFGARQIDTYRSEQSFTRKPYKCMFVECPSAQSIENRGS